ncbi:MAG: MATE family efflux transporter [Defluviitaleaceae bacterium]|nr:MATE family efflux transporter [Defluviitaleaceae bacterium]
MINKNDLTEGNITQKLVFISLPVIATQFMQMAYTIIDMFWLGLVSEDAVAASGTAGMYLWLSAAFMLVGQMGTSIGVSQSIGRGDRKEAERFTESAFGIAIALGIIVAAIFAVFREPLIGFFQIREASVALMAQDYLLIVSPFVPMWFVAGVITACYIASGDAKTPFFVNGLGLGLNILFDPLFIFTFGWGIKGAAAASIAAQGIALAVFIYCLKFSKSRPFSHIRILTRPNPVLARQIFAWALPVSAESFTFTVLSMMIARLIAEWGASALAVIRVGEQMESLSWGIGTGFAAAVTAFVGQNYGALKWKRIHKGVGVATAIMSCWGIMVSALLFFAAEPLMGLFLNEPETIRIGVSYLRIVALSQVPLCLEFVAAGAFRGVGRTLPPTIASIGTNVSRLALAHYLAGTALGLDGIWWAIAIGSAARGIWMFAWYLIYARKLPKENP